jgi:hypothetical protein
VGTCGEGEGDGAWGGDDVLIVVWCTTESITCWILQFCRYLMPNTPYYGQVYYYLSSSPLIANRVIRHEQGAMWRDCR